MMLYSLKNHIEEKYNISICLLYTSILDDDFLSPEKMSYKDKSVQLAVEKLIQIIRNDYQKNNKVVNIAFVDGRTG